MPRCWKPYLGFFLLIIAVQGLGSLATFSSVSTWYQTLEKPFWTPPDWVFGPVWTTLYIMIAISGARIWCGLEGNFRERLRHPALFVYWVQLTYNLLWSLLFFGLQSPLLGFLDILMLVITVALTIWRFSKLDKIAAWLLLPYFLWICYATTLNGGILFLN